MRILTKRTPLAAIFLNLLLMASVCQASTPPKIVVSIAPIHALVSGLTEGVTQPGLLVKGNASPHHYTLKPSERQQLEQADMIVWIGPDMETFLTKPLASLSSQPTLITLEKTPKLTLLPLRKSALFEDNFVDHAHHHHGEEAVDHHHSGEYDLHIWLDPDNALAIINYLEKALIKKDPDHKQQYVENAKKVRTRLIQLNSRLKTRLKPIKNQAFIVFHDAYQYFERQYHLKGVGAISLHPELPLKVDRIQSIKNTLQEKDIICVFSEPQFSPKILDTIIQNTHIKKGVLDPIGAETKNGLLGYEVLLENLAESLVTCLKPSS